MKKILVFCIIATLFTGYSCTSSSDPTLLPGQVASEVVTEVVPIRIVGVQEVSYKGQYYQIVQVDRREYLDAYNGGIIHMESCPCKQNR